MLLDLTCPTLASQSRKLVLVKQPDDGVLACSRLGQTELSAHRPG